MEEGKKKQIEDAFLYGSSLDNLLLFGEANKPAFLPSNSQKAVLKEKARPPIPVKKSKPEGTPLNRHSSINSAFVQKAQSQGEVKPSSRHKKYIADEKMCMLHTAASECVKILHLSHVKPIYNIPDCRYSMCPICLKEKCKASLMGQNKLKQTIVQQFCKMHDMYVQFNGNIAYITTIAGEWYFDYTEEEPTIHHRSTEKRTTRTGAIRHYHIQSIVLSGCLEAVNYIYRHDLSAMRRVMGGFGSVHYDEDTLPHLMDHLINNMGISISDMLYALSINRMTWKDWLDTGFQSADLQGVAGIAEILSVNAGDLLSFASCSSKKE